LKAQTKFFLVGQGSRKIFFLMNDVLIPCSETKKYFCEDAIQRGGRTEEKFR
jgi:hypothetical protein